MTSGNNQRNTGKQIRDLKSSITRSVYLEMLLSGKMSIFSFFACISLLENSPYLTSNSFYSPIWKGLTGHTYLCLERKAADYTFFLTGERLAENNARYNYRVAFKDEDKWSCCSHGGKCWKVHCPLSVERNHFVTKGKPNRKLLGIGLTCICSKTRLGSGRSAKEHLWFWSKPTLSMKNRIWNQILRDLGAITKV